MDLLLSKSLSKGDGGSDGSDGSDDSDGGDGIHIDHG